jgi:two-component system phosphate regulon sensor histidine kinase PhoR
VKRRRLFSQLFPTYLAITLVSLAIISWLAIWKIRHFYMEQTTSELQSIAKLIQLEVKSPFNPTAISELDSLCKASGAASGIRITLIDISGLVLGDSEHDPRTMENHSDRPEIKEALTHGRGIAIRYSPTLKQKMMYYAIPFQQKEKTIGVIRVSIPMTLLQQHMRQAYQWIVLFGIMVGLLAITVSFLVSRTIAAPLVAMEKGTRRFTEGDLDYKLPGTASKELQSLTTSLNQMASELHQRINQITKQRNELEAVLSSMVEGVMALDMEQRVISINHAALNILKISESQTKNRMIYEVVRNPDLQQFVAALIKYKIPMEQEIALGQKTYLQLHGTVLLDAQGNDIGILVVFNDISDLKQLEQIRRDFVANVSHELRTPITAIKGFVETLQEGAIDDKESAAHFLNIIGEHVDRLNTIIQDLLTLSKIERSADVQTIVLEKGNVIDVLNTAIQSCKSEADAKQIHLELESTEKHEALIDSHHLELAIINLLSNAIRYSDPGSTVKVGIEKTDRELDIYVKDEGCGIAPEHLSRIFERFYRVDSDRSRKLGGTGLGLAIVKHIALTHKGRVSVESTLDKGSTFRIHLPILT